MDYRSRWQQKRRRRQLVRLTLVPVAIVAAILVTVLVRAVSAGAVEWSYEGPDDNVVTPAIVGNLALAAFSEGELRCLRIVDGSEVWASPFRRPERFTSPPGVAEGLAVICADYGRVYAVELTDGELYWRVELPGPLRGTPLIVENTVYVACHSGKVYALDLHSGERRFAVETNASLSEQPVVSDRVLVVAGREGIIVGLNVGTGEQVWRRRLGVNVISAPAVVGDLVAIGSEQGRMYVIDPSDGQVRFTARAAAMIRNRADSDGGRLYFADTDGWLYSQDLGTGQRLFHRRLGNSLQAGPLLYGDALYCLVDGQRVVRVDPESGQVQRSWAVDPAACTMAAGSEHLVLGTYDGRAMAIAIQP